MNESKDKHSQFNRIRDIIYNEDNKLKHMQPISRMVEKFENDFGDCGLSKSLWKKYNAINNVLIKNS
jgi:hypothetical protein